MRRASLSGLGGNSCASMAGSLKRSPSLLARSASICDRIIFTGCGPSFVVPGAGVSSIGAGAGVGSLAVLDDVSRVHNGGRKYIPWSSSWCGCCRSGALPRKRETLRAILLLQHRPRSRQQLAYPRFLSQPSSRRRTHSCDRRIGIKNVVSTIQKISLDPIPPIIAPLSTIIFSRKQQFPNRVPFSLSPISIPNLSSFVGSFLRRRRI